MGHAAPGGAVSRDLSRSAAPPPGRARGASRHRARTRPLAALPPDVLLRRRQARQRRPDVARPHGSSPPLRDAAASDGDRLVRAPPSRESPERLRRGPVRRRARRAVPDLRAAPASQSRARPARGAPGRDRPDGQLRVLQPARDRALRARVRRPDAARPLPRRARARARARRRWPRPVLAALAVVIVAVSGIEAEEALFHRAWPQPAVWLARGRRAVSNDQQLRPLRRDDDDAPGDRRRGKRRRGDLEALRVPLEAGESRAPARVRRTAPAAPGLADVVRGARLARAEPVARGISCRGSSKAPPTCCAS